MNKNIIQKPKRSSRKRVNLSPPQIVPSISIGHVFRFQTSAATSIAVSGISLGDLLCVAATTTSAYQLANAVRIRKVEIWGTATNVFTPVTVSCDFSGSSAGSFGPSRIISDTSVGATRVAHVVAKPPRDSQANQWQSSSSASTLFTLVLPTLAVVDIHYSLTMRDSAGATSVTGAVAGATVGQLYVRALDSPSGTAVCAPLSYITI